MKNKPLGMLLALTLTSITVGAVLAGAYALFYPKIEANRIAEEKRAIFAVLEGAVSYEIIDVEVEGEAVRLFKGFSEDKDLVGYAFIAEGPGFQAMIKIMVGLNVTRKNLTGMKVLDQLETPGLGDKIAKPKFEGQFRGLAIEPKIEYLKNRKPEKPNQIQSITGATISSKAIVDTINKRIKIVLQALPAGAR